MNRFKRLLTGFAQDESGATMVEYAIMVALIAAVCIAVVKTVGTKSNTSFESINSSMT